MDAGEEDAPIYFENVFLAKFCGRVRFCSRVRLCSSVRILGVDKIMMQGPVANYNPVFLLSLIFDGTSNAWWGAV